MKKKIKIEEHSDGTDLERSCCCCDLCIGKRAEWERNNIGTIIVE